jgi:HK97 family phage prohead protease
MHETFTGDRPQEQAVAICLGYWREEHGGKPPAKTAKTSIKLSLTPAPSESHSDWMDRCQADGNSRADCENTWEDTADNPNGEPDDGGEDGNGTSDESYEHMIHKTHAGKLTGMDFVMSDETPDRMGDVIESAGWDVAEFRKNPIALFSHQSGFPIGKWRDVKVDGKQLRGTLELAPAGASPRIDEIRALVEAGILRAVSVGFKPKVGSPINVEAPWNGTKYSKQELVECSLVAVPANPNALSVAKSLHISPETIEMVFAGHGNGQHLVTREGSTGGHATTPKREEGRAMTISLSQRIVDARARITDLRDKLKVHMEAIDDTNVSDAQLETSNQLHERITQEEKGLEALVNAEKHLAGSTQKTTELAMASRSVVPAEARQPFSPPRPFGIPSKKVEPLDYLARAGAIALYSHITKRDLDSCRRMVYGDDEATKAVTDWITKATSPPAMTTVTGWAAELVQQVTTAFMNILTHKSIFPRLAGLGLSMGFGRNGRIVIPTRSLTPTIAGSFVGEGQPIPVRVGQFTSQVLTPKKMAVITTWTREIDEHSIPAIEGLLRQAIQEDTAVAIDTVLLDSNAATAVRPAGLVQGVTALTATTGGGFNALVGDIKLLTGALLTGTRGNIRVPCWIMNPQQVMTAGLIPMPGMSAFPFAAELSAGNLRGWPIIDSGTVPLGTVMVVDAADFVAVGGDAPRFEVSDQATLHEEDTTPEPIVDGGEPAAPVRSLWQTDTLALRLILPMNWALRRTGVVAWMQNVTW